MKKYRKRQLIEVVTVLTNGDVVVRNEGNPDDTWVVPRKVFASTYEEVIENGKEHSNSRSN